MTDHTQALAKFREAVMELARDIHAADCQCPKVPGVNPPPPYRSGWVNTAISAAHSVLEEMRQEAR